MLCRNVIATLLVAYIIILRVRASEDLEGSSLPNGPQISIGKGRTVLKAGPNGRNNYDSIVRTETAGSVYIDIAPGGPEDQEVSYARLDEPLGQKQANQNQKIHGAVTRQEGNVYISDCQQGSITYESRAILNGKLIPSETIQKGNLYINNCDSTNSTKSQADVNHVSKLILSSIGVLMHYLLT